MLQHLCDVTQLIFLACFCGDNERLRRFGKMRALLFQKNEHEHSLCWFFFFLIVRVWFFSSFTLSNNQGILIEISSTAEQIMILVYCFLQNMVKSSKTRQHLQKEIIATRKIGCFMLYACMYTYYSFEQQVCLQIC